MITLAEAARRAGVCPKTIREWSAAGKVNAKQNATTSGEKGRWQVDEVSLYKYCSSRTSRLASKKNGAKPPVTKPTTPPTPPSKQKTSNVKTFTICCPTCNTPVCVLS